MQCGRGCGCDGVPVTSERSLEYVCGAGVCWLSFLLLSECVWFIAGGLEDSDVGT